MKLKSLFAAMKNSTSTLNSGSETNPPSQTVDAAMPSERGSSHPAASQGSATTLLGGWNVNALAEALILELRDHLTEYESARRRAVADRREMERRLRSVPGLTVFPSRANFVYVRIPEPIDGVALRNWLLCEHGYLVRECGNKLGSDSSHFRLAVRPPEQAESLVEALTSAFRQPELMQKGKWSGG